MIGLGASSTTRKLLAWTHLDRLFATTAERFESRRARRAASAFERAISLLAEALDEGQGIRDDGFFSPKGDQSEEPSNAEEILEGVLTVAAETAEARKAIRMGDLFAFIALNGDITPAHGNVLIDLAESLTYQQLLLLGVLTDGERRPDLPDETPTGLFTYAETGLIMSIFDLARRGLVFRKDNQPVVTFAEINPAQMKTALNGTILVEAMNLLEAEEDEWKVIAEVFARLGKIDAGKGGTAKVRLDGLVPPGSPPDIKRVKIDKQVVTFEEPVKKLKDLPG